MAHEILIVDDEPDIRTLLEGILSDEGFATRPAHDADSPLAASRYRPPPPPSQVNSVAESDLGGVVSVCRAD